MMAASLSASLLRVVPAGRGIKSKMPKREPAIPGIGVLRAGEGTTSITKMNLNFKVFIQEIIYLK